MTINRREAVQRVAALMGGMISAPAMAGIMGQKTNNGTNYESINEYLNVFRKIESNIKELTEIGI